MVYLIKSEKKQKEETHMKKPLTKALATLLATLLLLGAGAVSAGAAPGETPAPRPALRAVSGELQAAGKAASLEIVTPGKAQANLYNYGSGYYELDTWDLDGLVLKASGGGLAKPQTIDCDDVYAQDRYKPKVGKIVWDVWVNLNWREQSEGWLVGENQAIVCAQAWQYTAFVPTKVIDGVQYGYFESEHVFYGETPIVITGVCSQDPLEIDKEAATALSLGVEADVSIAAWDWETEDQSYQWFKFTPAESGLYVFKSNGGRYSENLWTEDGEEQYFPGISPYATLFDENGCYMTYDYGSAGNRNFLMRATLEAGKTYYLRATTYNSEGGAYTVVVKNEAPKSLAAKANEITIKNGEYIDMADLVEVTGWELEELYVSCEGYSLVHEEEYDEYYGWYVKGFTAYSPGTETLYISAPNGAQVKITVTVKFSVAGLWQTMKATLSTLKELTRNIPGALQELYQTFKGYSSLTLLFAFPFVLVLLPVFLLVIWFGIIAGFFK